MHFYSGEVEFNIPMPGIFAMKSRILTNER